MKYEEIRVGIVYVINYLDTSYPCDCECHEPGNNVVHVMPCCYDRSYQGEATCVASFDDENSHLYAVSKVRFIRLEAEHVEAEVGGRPPLSVSLESIDVARRVLGVE